MISLREIFPKGQGPSWDRELVATALELSRPKRRRDACGTCFAAGIVLKRGTLVGNREDKQDSEILGNRLLAGLYKGEGI